ncbi:MAG: hypothetical protein JW840_06830 [Candidatus Thermoplasmatota archaeon]|nr:hypothetical protein [Candidatus Thermoplasmatota archaeon]
MSKKAKKKEKEQQEEQAYPDKMKWVSTKIVDDVFTDEISLFKPRFEVDYDQFLKRLWDANPEIYQLLKASKDLEAARDSLYSYLEKSERAIFEKENSFHILEKATVREAIRVLKSIIGPINEFRTGFSALEVLWKFAQDKRDDIGTKISVGFLMEFIRYPLKNLW